MLLAFWLNIYFAHKLHRVYKDVKYDKSNNDSLVPIITRICILSMTSSIWTLIELILVMTAVSNNSPHSIFVARFVLLCDLYSNFTSILLSYSRFKSWYLRIYGCCDTKCITVFGASMTPDEKNLAETMEGEGTEVATQSTLDTDIIV